MIRPVQAPSILASLLAGLLLALPALAQTPGELPPVYRVELIVFEHVDGRSDQRPAAEPLDFTAALDPNALAVFASALDDHLQSLAAILPTLTLPPRSGPGAPALVRSDEQIQPVPRDYTAIELSPTMQRALARLEASPAQLPVATRAWYQGAGHAARTAPVRVHDAEVVAIHQPPTPSRPLFLPQLGPVLGRDLPFESIPMQRPIHRIDGTVRLRRTQFLRLELDLVLQQPPGDDDAAASDPRWQLHRLQQARAIRPDRFEYFDSSRFGVLARITEFERIEPEIEPEPVIPPVVEPTTEPGAGDSG
jgi:hypothetical protein